MSKEAPWKFTFNNFEQASPTVQGDEEIQTYRVKAAILGDWSTGKTSMLNCLTGRDLEEIGSTIGVGFFTQYFHMPDWCTNLYLWDTSGTERFRSIITPYLRNVAIVAIVFDVTTRTTWEHVDYWRNLAIDESKHAGEELPLFCLIGCQADKGEPAISLDEMKEKARLWNDCPYWKVSTREPLKLEGCRTKFLPVGAESLPMAGTESFSRRDRISFERNPSTVSVWSTWLNFPTLSPREQMFTVFGEMVVRFHALVKEMGVSHFLAETCSLGTLEQDDDVIRVTARKKKRKCCLE